MLSSSNLDDVDLEVHPLNKLKPWLQSMRSGLININGSLPCLVLGCKHLGCKNNHLRMFYYAFLLFLDANTVYIQFDISMIIFATNVADIGGDGI